MIRIQEHDFDQHEEYLALAQGPEAGAVVTFVGRVRQFSDNPGDLDPTTEHSGNELFLQHYPGMTEKVLQDIEREARQRWSLLQVRIVHRVGHLQSEDQIVFVGVSARHRKSAFNACEFIMDFLKSEAPFWKKEGERWVQAKASDTDAARSWNE